MRVLLLVLMTMVCAGLVAAQTPTPEPTATPLPIADVYATLQPAPGETTGQTVRFSYSATAGDVYVSILLALILFSLWAVAIVVLLIVWRLARR